MVTGPYLARPGRAACRIGRVESGRALHIALASWVHRAAKKMKAHKQVQDSCERLKV